MRTIAPWIVALVLGLITTLSVTVGLALWQPVDGTRAVMTGTGTIIQDAAGNPTVTISTDGDHLQPWHILLERPGAQREVWFEKGRVYNKYVNGAPVGHAGASNAALSCWSFATASRGMNPTKRTFPVAEGITSLTEASPPTAWAAAIDRRGWPFTAFQGCVMGTMDSKAPQPWVIAGGYDIDGVTAAGGPQGAAGWRSGNLATIRFIPIEPLWPGLLGNTLVFAAAWGGLLWGANSLLRRLRKRVGLCPDCGYDLSGQREPGCPECGRGRGAATAAVASPAA